MSVLQRFLSSSDKSRKGEQVEPCEEVEEGQPHNPYTELLILQRHSDIVRLLLRISDRRFVSAGDDNKIIVWDVQSGRHIASLIGHTHPITSLIYLSKSDDKEAFIVSGSSDRQIRFWNEDTGECHFVLTDHGASVRCLQVINSELFCAGGGNLSLWNRHGKCLHTIQKFTQEDIDLMILIKNDRVVTAADKELVVYKLHDAVESGCDPHLAKVKQINSHQEAIRSLVPVSSSCFASGSVDGVIIIWTSSNLQAARTFNNSVNCSDGDVRKFSTSVQALMCVQERYLFAAIGCDFYAFDVTAERETLVLQKKSAHLSKITSIGFACEGEFLATCSEDRCLRLWGQKPSSDPWKSDMAVSTMERFTGQHSQELSNNVGAPWEPSLLGECSAHSGSVQGFMDFDHEGIVTCGADGLVIIWKNSEMQKVRRNQLVRKLLMSSDGIV